MTTKSIQEKHFLDVELTEDELKTFGMEALRRCGNSGHILC